VNKLIPALLLLLAL